jgi:hypothetical protein
MIMRATLLAISILAGATLACTRDLTHDKAESVLQEYAEFVKPTSILVAGTIDTRMWLNAGVVEFGAGSGGQLPLGAEGRRYFRSLTFTSAELLTPLERHVTEITGITAGSEPAERIVTFKWQYKMIPTEITQYTGETSGLRDGTAYFRLYDDGWRVERVISGSPAATTDAPTSQQPRHSTSSPQSFACEPRTLSRGKSLVLSLPPGHGRELGIMTPDRGLLFVAFRPESPTCRPPITSDEFLSKSSLELNTASAVGVYTPCDKELVPVFQSPGTYELIVSPNLETEDTPAILRCKIEFKAG